ncbi:MAG: hypothetical protein V3R84_00860 [Acidimicrobiia bacterium]
MGRSTDGHTLRRRLAVGSLTVMLVACGGDGLSLAEYAETLGALASDLGAELGTGDAQVVAEPTIETARDVITVAVDTRNEFQAALTSLDPPAEIADVHMDLVDVHARIISAQEAFAERAVSATTLEELDGSEEAGAYRAINAEALSICREFQTRIDATADQGVFAAGPWIAGDLKEAVEVTLDC